ncbi:hypothetical protein IPN35_03200 [Candidatus Peregrinibacteria bacterium]|nr:MAG: hypothetical protein IPN35_03200 [Candidatus Peregrinibacteria bacterium]
MKKDPLTPFDGKFSSSIGRGKDNVVVSLMSKMPKEERGEEYVVKWNHNPKEPMDPEGHFWRILYKKKKYEMLEFFLGGFIPESFFILGNKKDGSRTVVKEYTVQERVPQVTIASLSESQKEDPRLLRNIYLLILKLQNMYRMLERVNSVVEDSAKIDAKLDLGGLSKYADRHKDENLKNFDWSVVNYDFMSSPNLLVDPETMKISCIDFDQGVWSNEKEATWTLLFIFARQNEKVMNIIKMEHE